MFRHRHLTSLTLSTVPGFNLDKEMTSLVKIFALKKEGDPYTWSYRAPIIDGLKNK